MKGMNEGMKVKKSRNEETQGVWHKMVPTDTTGVDGGSVCLLRNILLPKRMSLNA